MQAPAEPDATLHSPPVRPEHRPTRHQRVVERLTAYLGRPSTVYALLGTIFGWLALNLMLPSFGLRAPDPLPFPLLQGLATLSALAITTAVLVTQNRQMKLAERRERLDLEINLTAERKIAKLIELLEELRRDLPNVPNRHDPEAVKMQASADPHAIAEQLERQLEDEVSAEEDAS